MILQTPVLARFRCFLERLYGGHWEAMVLAESREARLFELRPILAAYLGLTGAEGGVCSSHGQLTVECVPGTVDVFGRIRRLSVLGFSNSCRRGYAPPSV